MGLRHRAVSVRPVRSASVVIEVGRCRLIAIAMASIVMSTVALPIGRASGRLALHSIQSAPCAAHANLHNSLTVHRWVFPPHQTLALPNDAQHDWMPFAEDPKHVLMVGSPAMNPHAKPVVTDNPYPVKMTVATPGSLKMTPINPDAYPHKAVLGRSYVDWPWIAGEYWTGRHFTQWTFFAANAVTGRSAVLGHFYPNGVSMSGGLLAWTSATFAPHGGPTSTWVQTLNLKTWHQSRLAYTRTRGVFYAQPTISDGKVVFTRLVPHAVHDIWNLILLNPKTGSLTDLTHNWVTKGTDGDGVSSEPALWEGYLLFKQGPSPISLGDIVLWKLGGNTYPLWRHKGRAWVADTFGEGPMFGDGLAAWQADGQGTIGILDLSRGAVWDVQNPRKMLAHGGYKYTWSLEWIAGRNIIVKREGNKTYTRWFIWRMPPLCTQNVATG